MNERIDELIEECTSVNDDLVYDGSDSYMKTTEYFDKEKFAELIVRECASKVDSSLRDWLHDNSGGTMGDKLKQHFGVEE